MGLIIAYAGAFPDGLSLADGEWHMLTLSTRRAGTAGFSLYVDGRLVGQVGQCRPHRQSLCVPMCRGSVQTDQPRHSL